MNGTNGNRPRRKGLKWFLALFFALLFAAVIFLYNNYNRLLAESLQESFNANIASDVYELKFRNLNVNFFQGNIRVNDVDLRPREKPLKEYPYINSSFHLKTSKVILGKVEILTLLRHHQLRLERVEIVDPSIEFTISDVIPVFFPFAEVKKDSVLPDNKNGKRIVAVSLKQFDLVNASMLVANSAKGRDLSVKGVTIAIRDLLTDQQPGKDLFSYRSFHLLVNEISGSLKRDKLNYLHLKDYSIDMDSLTVQKTTDTLIYRFRDLQVGLKELDVITADSIFHLQTGALKLSYRDKFLGVSDFKFEPMISEEAMQKRYEYQNTQFSGSFRTMQVRGINYDSLVFRKKLLVDEIALDTVRVFIFKDKTKPMDLKKFPEYLGQILKKIRIPLQIRAVSVTNADLVNRERKPDKTYATANINGGTVAGVNLTNIDTTRLLSLSLKASLENKVPFSLTLEFDYQKPEFTLEGSFGKFNLPDLNPLISSYTPAKINSGTADAIHFKGVAYEKYAIGTMKFLYHDLNMDLELKEKAKWKSSVLAFAANTVVASANPPYEDQPPKIVEYRVDRDMNKSFVNITIKSALSGLKETVMMSKENRKNYKEQKKKAKEENRTKK